MHDHRADLNRLARFRILRQAHIFRTGSRVISTVTSTSAAVDHNVPSLMIPDTC
jgi:hypothetical protein